MATPDQIRAGLDYLRSCANKSVRYVKWNGVWPPDQLIFYMRHAPAPPPEEVSRIGVLCSGAINLFWRSIEGKAGAGTLWWEQNLVNTRPFEPGRRYPVGTILGYPFRRDNDGHVIVVSTPPNANGDQKTIGADTGNGLSENLTVRQAHAAFNLTYAGEIPGVGAIPLDETAITGDTGVAQDDPGPPPYVMLDTAIYPGRNWLKRVYDHSNTWAFIFYLPDAPSHSWTSYRGKRQEMVDIGFGLAPTYVGQQLSGPGSKILTAEQGRLDGKDAARKMREEGFPEASVCYLDVEGGDVNSRLVDYAAAWINEVNDHTPYEAGMYASPRVADAIMAEAPDVVYWAVRADFACSPEVNAEVYGGAKGDDSYWTFDRPDPGKPHGKAVMWQWCLALGNRPCKLWDVPIDINTISMLDPSKAKSPAPSPDPVPATTISPPDHRPRRRLEERVEALEKEVKRLGALLG